MICDATTTNTKYAKATLKAEGKSVKNHPCYDEKEQCKSCHNIRRDMTAGMDDINEWDPVVVLHLPYTPHTFVYPPNLSSGSAHDKMASPV